MVHFNNVIEVGSVNVVSTSNRPMSPEEWAQLAADRIVYVGNQTEGPIRDQALAYKENIKNVISYYIRQAVLSNEKHLLVRNK